MGIQGDQVTIATIIASPAQHQNRSGRRPVPEQLAKRSPGRGLHQLKAINTLLINKIPIHRSNRVGGVQGFW